MKIILISVGFTAAMLAMIALMFKCVVWILSSVQWLAAWCTDWREEYQKWNW